MRKYFFKKQGQADLPDLFKTVTADKARNMNPLVLAFIGDAVHSLYVRQTLAINSDSKAGGLHKIASKTVSAANQSLFAEKLIPHLTEEELALYKRARNAKKGTKAKNSTVKEYNSSTGFEAVLGFLYITGDYTRLYYLLKIEEKDES